MKALVNREINKSGSILAQGENLRNLIPISKFYQNSHQENKSVSSVYVVYVLSLLFFRLLCVC